MSEVDSSQKWIDVTRPVSGGMYHWPGDPDVELVRVVDICKGDHCNVTRLTMCTHTGTHIDAPLHFLKDGKGVEHAPLEVLIGPARVIEIDDPVSIRKSDLESHGILEGERLLFRTRNVEIPWDAPFDMGYIYIAADAASYLVERKVQLVGIDGMSVGGFYQDMVETHVTLLGAGIWIVENLDLRDVVPGLYDLVCLPIKLVGSDGAPARVILRQR